MLNTVFYYVLNMSINACFIILFMLLLRNIRAIPRTFVYGFWSVAFIRLLVPFAISSPFSLFNFTGNLIKRIISVDTIITEFEKVPFDLSTTNAIGAAKDYFPVTYKTTQIRDIFVVSSNIWLIGVLVSLLTAVILYAFTRAELKKAIRIRDNIYSSPMLMSPVLVGIIKPKIILPSTFDPDCSSAEYVIAHENVHKKRLDNLWRMLGITIVCLHWFNPFAWILLKYFFADMELSCDEKIVKNYDTAKRKEYANTLVNFAEDKKLLMSAAFGKTTVKVRVINVLNYRRMTTIGASVSILFLLAIAAALITNPHL